MHTVLITFFKGRNVGAKVDVSERPGSNLAAEPVLVPHSELHGGVVFNRPRSSPRFSLLHLIQTREPRVEAMAPTACGYTDRSHPDPDDIPQPIGSRPLLGARIWPLSVSGLAFRQSKVLSEARSTSWPQQLELVCPSIVSSMLSLEADDDRCSAVIPRLYLLSYFLPFLSSLSSGSDSLPLTYLMRPSSTSSQSGVGFKMPSSESLWRRGHGT